MRVRRSLIWVNGYDMDKLKAAIDSEVDTIVLDLEDGVTVSQKAEARQKTYDALKNWDFKGKERAVRVNALDTPFFPLDLEEVLPALPDAVRLPKCETVDYVLKMDQILWELEQKNHLPQYTIKLILMIETALGVINSYDLARCTPRVEAMGIGMEDLTSSMGVTRRYELGSHDLLYARQKVILSAKAAGVQAIDSGVMFTGDLDFYMQDCLNDKQDGYEGRSVGDLNHIALVNKAFSPTAEELDWAHRIIAAYDKAVADGKSDVTVDGKYVDPPVVSKATRILERDRQINKK